MSSRVRSLILFAVACVALAGVAITIRLAWPAPRPLIFPPVYVEPR